MKIISCTAVHKTYRQSHLLKKNRPVINDLSFDVFRGEVFGIVGPNGAGKSTTIKAIMGFIRADSGTITINGLEASSPRAHTTIGYLPETACLYRNLTLIDHLLFASRLTDQYRTERKRRISEVLQMVNLEAAASLPIRQYSKGMTQRAALAYALFTDPEILILDEPMSGLDPLGRQLVIDIMRKSHEKGATILFCSHILNDVERICNRIGIMDQGRLVHVTTPEQLTNNYTDRPKQLTPLEACFLETINRQGCNTAGDAK